MRPAIGAICRRQNAGQSFGATPREDNMTSVRALRGAVASAVLLLHNPANAADWPSRPITAVSAVSAGNAGDTIARIVLDQVSRQIGQGFVLENRPGGDRKSVV